MRHIRIANAPCSWGSLEFEGLGGEQVEYGRMLDELVATGYDGTELGDWGYMPTDPDQLRSELSRRGIAMVGAFVPVRLRDPAAHAEGAARAMAVARLLAALHDDDTDDGGGAPASRTTAPSQPIRRDPLLILADDNGSDPVRVRNAGRIDHTMGLDHHEWLEFAAAAERIARNVLEETGIRTAFHHHCAGYVETPEEIARFLELTDPKIIGLVFDTGHYAFGGGGCAAVPKGFESLIERIRHVHFKDYDPAAAAAVFDEDGNYFDAVGRGVFCELGRGCVDFGGILSRMEDADYRGWIVVEQDVLPGMGSPAESARRNREFLQQLGI